MKSLPVILLLLFASCSTTPPASSPSRVVTTESGDELVAPRVVRRADPEYPASLRNQGVQGTVALSAEIGVDGVPRNIEVVSSSHPALNQYAEAALRKWQFEPGTKNGEPVPVIFTMSIDFAIH